MDWITTSTMLARMQRFDDQEVWQRFFERFRRPLERFAQRCGLSQVEAEDAAQEALTAFLESFRAGKYERAKGRLSSWLFGIAFQLIANRRRRNAREAGRRAAPDAAGGEWADVSDERAASNVWDAEWEAATLEACMRQAQRELSEKTFEAFRLIVRDNRTADEAAAALGMTREAVYVAKHRVLKRLNELMQEYEHFRDDA